MCRIIAAVLFGSVALLGSPAGADDRKPADIAGWGAATDPAGDCGFAAKDGKLVITVPGSATAHNLNPTPEYDNLRAPRVLRAVDGDFTLQVKVFAFPRPQPKSSTTSQGHSYLAAGLLLWVDDKTFIRCTRSALGERGDVYMHVEPFRNGKAAPQGYQLLKDRRIADEDTYLQVERHGDGLTFSRSSDGKKWEAVVRAQKVQLPKKIHVGVVAVNATNKDFAPQLADFSLTAR